MTRPAPAFPHPGPAIRGPASIQILGPPLRGRRPLLPEERPAAGEEPTDRPESGDARTGAATLIAGIVDRGHGWRITAAARAAGAPASTVLAGSGTARSDLLQLLGFGGRRKEVVLAVVPADAAPGAFRAIAAEDWASRKVRGILFSMDVLRPGGTASSSTTDAETDMNPQEPAGHELIAAIVNAGYAEDAVAEARKAGATGATILHGMGTAREGDATYLGVPIVPEKDVVFILAQAGDSRRILEAVKGAKGLKEPGVGIVFVAPVREFARLGSK